MTSRSPDQSSQGVVAIRDSPPNCELSRQITMPSPKVVLLAVDVAQRLPYIKIEYTSSVGNKLSMIWSREALEGMSYAVRAQAA